MGTNDHLEDAISRVQRRSAASSLLALATMLVGLVAVAAPAAAAGPASPAGDVEDPRASVGWSCGAEAVTVELDNTASGVDVGYTISVTTEPGAAAGGDDVAIIDSISSEDVLVAAGEVETSTTPRPDEGDTTTVAVTAGERVLAESVIVVDCEGPEAGFACAAEEQWIDTDGDGVVVEEECNEVLGDQLTRTPAAVPTAAGPEALAYTGVGSEELLWSGAAMILVGVGLVLAGRESRTI